jgi:hypothetical protein
VLFEYSLKHIAGILQTLIAEFQPLILGAGSDLTTGTPAPGRFPFASQTLQFLRRDFLAGILETSGGQLRKSLLIAGGVRDIYFAFPAKTAASSL